MSPAILGTTCALLVALVALACCLVSTVRHSFRLYTLLGQARARKAELQAENDRLRQEVASWINMATRQERGTERAELEGFWGTVEEEPILTIRKPLAGFHINEPPEPRPDIPRPSVWARLRKPEV